MSISITLAKKEEYEPKKESRRKEERIKREKYRWK
jgi:hypothetical protein